ncbi:hypothetical protein WJX79_009803 [Trebouxia sp. C0005]
MSGFDVGRVSTNSNWVNYTEDDRNTDANETRPPISTRAALAKLHQFLKTYAKSPENGQSEDVYIYSDALQKDCDSITVDLQDIKLFDDDLYELFRKNPGVALPLLEAAVMKCLNPRAKKDEEMQIQREVFLIATEQFGPATIRELQSEDISRLVMISGVVTRSEERQNRAAKVVFKCKSCSTLKTVIGKPGLGKITCPKACDSITVEGSGNLCGRDPFVIDDKKCKFVDHQILKLQDLPETVSPGEPPEHRLMIVEGSLVHSIPPGTQVTVTAVYNIMKTKHGAYEGYLRAVGVQHIGKQDLRRTPFTAEEEARFKAFAAQPELHKKIFEVMAPSIYGHDDIKKAVACLLFGGARKLMPDGTARRGDIHVLLIGDPSTAKSQFLKFAAQMAPVAVYTAGKTSSGPGLTGSMLRKPNGQFYLEAGAMVTASGGVICIDEFDKMQPEDRVVIHEGMEQQTISIAKAGITATLNSQTSVLAAANPPSGRYDDMVSAQENMDLQTTILSRFDLIFIVRDVTTREHDERLARHICHMHQQGHASNQLEDRDEQEDAFLTRYVQYCRQRCDPRMTEEAATYLSSEYVDIREQVRQRIQDDDGEAPAVPITVRQLEAVVRISEALARMQLCRSATQYHVQLALDLFKVSTLNAANAGVADDVVFTEADQEELKHVISEINKRIPLGGDDYEYKRARRTLHRI